MRGIFMNVHCEDNSQEVPGPGARPTQVYILCLVSVPVCRPQTPDVGGHVWASILFWLTKFLHLSNYLFRLVWTLKYFTELFHFP